MAKILYMDYYLPQNRVSAKKHMDSIEIPIPHIYKSKEEYNQAFIKQLEIEYLCIENEKNLIEIFSDMLKRFFELKKIDKTQIKYIFYTKAHRSYYAFRGDGKYYADNKDENSVSIPYYLAAKFGLEQACIIVNDGKCSSVIQAIEMSSMCCQEKGGYALILDPSFSSSPNRYMNIALLGDGAGIMLIGNEKNSHGYEIIDSLIKTSGIFSLHLYEKNKDAFQVFGSVATMMSELCKYDNIFEKQILLKRGIKNKDIKAAITLNVKVLVDLYKRIYTDRLYDRNLPYGGHISDVDLIRNFKDYLIDSGNAIEEGDYIVLVAYGTDFTGLEYGSVLLQYD